MHAIETTTYILSAQMNRCNDKKNKQSYRKYAQVLKKTIEIEKKKRFIFTLFVLIEILFVYKIILRLKVFQVNKPGTI